MPAISNTILAELEDAVQSHSADKRVATLRRVTDLFLGEADRLNDEQIGVFDDVLANLIQRIETKALAELSSRLAPIQSAPIEVIRRLARHDEITVAGPVLAESPRLTASDLIEVARTKGQRHLLAISGRRELEETVTDVLLTHGDREVASRLATNSGARFSEAGFETLVRAGETDAALAEKVGLRLDLPIRLLRELLLKATEAVRSRLLSLACPENQEEIRRALSMISNEISREVTAPRDFTKALEQVLSMQKNEQLNEGALLLFANARKYEETVVALSLLCGASIELIKPLMKAATPDGLLIPCKAADLKWATVSAILKTRVAHHSISDEDLARCKSNFIALSTATAQRTLRFWMVRTVAASPTAMAAQVGSSNAGAAMTNDERRISAGYRSSEDRRSGLDARSDEERRLIGERRSNLDRRSSDKSEHR
jgi:uncharacterized protein (DUF2336 family)